MKPTILLLFLAAISNGDTLKVEAGAHDRIQTVVNLPIPTDAPENPALKTADGKTLPLQLSDDGNATFILPELAAGKTAEFKLVALEDAAPDSVKAAEKGDNIAFSLSGKPVASFKGKATELPRPEIAPVFLRGGYLHPLLTPSGTVVTDDYPKNHLHHHGIWTAWTNTVFQGRKTDFWNSIAAQGKVDCKGIEFSWSGPVHAGVEAENEFIDLTSGKPIVALNERWTVKAYAIQDGKNPYNLIELVSEQEMAGDDDLELPEYHYGGIGIRGLGEWDGAENATFLTSEGITNRDEANAKPAKWIAMTGAAGEGKASIAILGHPKNFRAPQPLRVHPTEPFISFAPQIAGDMKISHERNLPLGIPLRPFRWRAGQTAAQPPLERLRRASDGHLGIGLHPFLQIPQRIHEHLMRHLRAVERGEVIGHLPVTATFCGHPVQVVR